MKLKACKNSTPFFLCASLFALISCVSVTARNANSTDGAEGSGTGTLRLSASWPQLSLTNPTMSSILRSYTGVTRPLDFTVDATVKTASCSATDVPAGYHTLIVKLLDNGRLVKSSVEVVRIFRATATNGIILLDPNVRLQIDIMANANMADPLRAIITGARNTKAENARLTLGATIEERVTTTYGWYVNGEQKGTEQSFVVDTSYPPGIYRINLTTFSVDGRRAGNTEVDITVTRVTKHDKKDLPGKILDMIVNKLGIAYRMCQGSLHIMFTKFFS